jgi:hypothetical protein
MSGAVCDECIDRKIYAVTSQIMYTRHETRDNEIE